MGIFDNLEDIDETVETVEENVVASASAFIKESGAFVITITKFWFSQNDNNTTFYNWEGVTDDGRKITDKEWFVTKDGRMQFPEKDFKTKKPTGKMRDFSGFARLKVISRALTGDEMAWRKTEKKFIPIYDFNAQADIDTEVDAFVAAVGVKVEILVRRTLEDKTQIVPATGEYEPIAEVRALNDVKAWLDHETHKSYNETIAKTDAKSYNTFMKAIEETPILDNRDVSKDVDMNAPREEAAPSDEAKNAFA